MKNKYFRSPWLEVMIMVGSVVLSYVGLAILATQERVMVEGEMSVGAVFWILLAFFLISVAIAAISVIAGIGGGVIFTPLMLAFTNVNSLVVRGAGLIVAMFSGLISTGVFLKKGMGNYRLCLVMMLSQAVGALSGAIAAVAAADAFGKVGEGVLRAALGGVLIAVAVYFLIGGQKLEWPEVHSVDRFTQLLHMDSSYYEESEGRVRSYRVKKAGLGILLIFFVGVLGGFFGMGGGWAITPVLNMAMGVPLKLAAANSGIILGVGSCVSIWPYMFAGSIIPLFVLPWLSGQVVGGYVGSLVLAKIKVNVVRLILIGIMFYTSFGLVTKGLSMIGLIGNVPQIWHMIIFAVIIVIVSVMVVLQIRSEKREGTDG